MAISETVQESKTAEHGLGTLLRMTYQAMMADAVEPALAAAGYDTVRSAHLPVFQTLATHPTGMRSTDLATYGRITKQSMGYLVDHLDANGYVERIPDPSDQRAKVVRLTPRGWAVSQAIRAAVREVEVDWGRRVGAARMRQLRSTLQDLVESLER